jgi:hypothetical protein
MVGQMMNSIQTLMQRGRRYWFVDGFWEMGLGIVLLADGGAFLVLSLWTSAGIFPLVLTLLLTGAVGPFLTRQLKASITYPRTGYAGAQPSLNSGVRKWVIGVLLVLLVFAWLAIPAAIFLPRLTANQPELRAATDAIPLFVGSLLPFVIGVTLASVLASWGYKYKIERFYLLATISALVGSALSLSAILNWGDIVSSLFDMSIYCTLMGLALLMSGLFTFRAYLRQNPAPMEEMG